MQLIGRGVVLAVSLTLAPFIAEGQQAGKIYRIGFLRYLACPEQFGLANLRQGLRERGYVEGHNIVLECRDAAGKAERFSDLAAELTRLNVDVLVTESTVAALAAKQATKTVPIVMLYVGDPVASGLVSSLAQPGGNATGFAMFAPEMIRKNLELLKELAPRLSRVSVFIDTTNPGQTLPDQQMDVAAKILGVRPQRIDLRTGVDLDGAFAEALRQRAEALLIYPLPITLRDFQRISEFSVKHRLPTITVHRAYVEAGLLMYYGPNVAEQYRRAAIYIDRILKGASPAQLPIEQSEKFELVINLKTAKALGLTIPQSILLRADHVIQ
jgi:putative tryptophan/tyrosine transport system substrate-binding protein